MINKYSLWNIAVFGGGGGDGGGRNTSGDRENLYSAPIGPGLESSPGYAETPKEYNSRGEPTATGSLQNATNEAELGQPPGLTSFTTAAFPGSIVPTGGFTGYPTSNGLSNEFLSGANSAQIAGQALDEMGGIPSPQMAADLAAMGGVLAPSTPMPQARPENLGPEYSQVDFSENRSFPSFARELGTGQAMVSPGEAALAGMGPSSIMGYKTAEQAMNEAAQQQGLSGYDTLMAAANGQPSPLDNNIMAKILDSVVTPAKAEDNPPTITPLPGNVPLPPTRPVETAMETPPAPAPAPVPMPTARPESMDDQLKAAVVTPPAPTIVPSSSPFEDAINKIVKDAPKNLIDAGVGLTPAGIPNTLIGLTTGNTIGSLATGQPISTTSPLEGFFSGIGHALGDLFGTNPAKGETINAYETRFPASVESAINGSYLNGVPSKDWVNTAYTGPTGPIPAQNSGHGGPDIMIPPVIPPVVLRKTAATTTPVTPIVTPTTLASAFGRTYVGAPINPLRYGYGPEATYYKTAAKGGMISPLNRMREVNGK